MIVTLDNEKEENVPNNDYFEYLLFVFAVIFSILFMFFNGASFSSENTRITKLIKGKIEINFFPVDKISLFDKKFCELLNSITCYRLTILQLLYSISILSLISFVFLLISLILGLKNSWPQTIFFRENIFASMIMNMFLMYQSNVSLCLILYRLRTVCERNSIGIRITGTVFISAGIILNSLIRI